ncbi:MAG: hypothetical protein KF749_07585 [Bacteroidetes bacterium]|nr:hypothetical protein [Bacteroidota bacterium]MCW5896847.1 hypothetical protein [Bacteroidota bacterium]
MKPTRTLTTLLAGIVDYAGLFPPAGLSMAEAVKNYDAYLRGNDAWALGRFIVPVARLDEFAQEAMPMLSGSPVWKLSALAGPNPRLEIRQVAAFNDRCIAKALIDTIEAKAASADEIRNVSAAVPASLQLFIEIPIQTDPADLIAEIGRHRRSVKVRTGGITADVFPSSQDLARFIHACVKENVAFKATAGLHHPIRAAYNLTYKPDSEQGKMYGYLNVFLAAAFARKGMSLDDTVKVLEEESPEALALNDNHISWHEHHLEASDLQEVRQHVAISFGSCSFREPMDDLRRMQLM